MLASTSTTNTTDSTPYHGLVQTTMHALQLCHAAQQGLIPRITRRLSDEERGAQVRSGAVFIFSVRESGMQRWTDHRPWGPSRIVGNFLVYRELSQRGTGRRKSKASVSEDKPKSPSPDHTAAAASSEEFLKSDGLIKKTITIGINGSDLHLVSYYTQSDIRANVLKNPMRDHSIASLRLPVEVFSLGNLRHPPTVIKGRDGRSAFSFNSEHLDDLEFRPDNRERTSLSPHSPTLSRRTSPPSPRDEPRSGRHWSHDLTTSSSSRSSTRDYPLTSSSLSTQWPHTRHSRAPTSLRVSTAPASPPPRSRRPAPTLLNVTPWAGQQRLSPPLSSSGCYRSIESVKYEGEEKPLRYHTTLPPLSHSYPDSYESYLSPVEQGPDWAVPRDSYSPSSSHESGGHQWDGYHRQQSSFGGSGSGTYDYHGNYTSYGTEGQQWSARS